MGKNRYCIFCEKRLTPNEEGCVCEEHRLELEGELYGNNKRTNR